ncbi:hypothetical protein A3Q34_18250 [Colwellia sp. PAMC 20917]|uniref:hypothetical protein n=1 Tax=Colwellia sp. PAMC 20917 TaxID=1816218 RepID=UPI000878C678|nr:hypothetical protein [Colwellia sp. PAMC 20917]AOW78606.1 hypothetical protein A3Q34_18250 [Colwellia sp. PAMC 20917]
MLNKLLKTTIILCSLSIMTQVSAEDDVAKIKPLDMVTDVNSVDLLSGKYTPNLPILSTPLRLT